MRFLFLYICTLAVFFLSCAALIDTGNAQASDASPQFFVSIDDIPLMDGLTEISDAAVSFDKPQGRIIEAVAVMPDTVTQKDVLAYYKSVLPSFGWIVAKDGKRFTRGKEVLEMTFDKNDTRQFVKIMIKPSS